MARVRRSSDLGSKDARRRLKARREPYFHMIERGLALGYRKSSEGGSWIVRRYDPNRRRHFEERVGTADDHRDADGIEALDFSQAQRKVLEGAKHAAELASGKLYTVADAAGDYVHFMRAHRKSADDAETKLKAYVIPKLGEKRVSDLTARDFEEWLAWALKRKSAKAKKPEKLEPRVEVAAGKGKPGPKPKVKPKKLAAPIDPVELSRRKKSTVNRVLATLKACLNHAHASKRVKSRDAWSLLRKFRSVDSARTRWLTLPEVTRLVNASAPNLRNLISAALLTGCREGELLAATARDFDSRSKTLLVPDSKSGKPRRVPLTDEGVKFFEAETVGKLESERLFTRSDGSPWNRVAIFRAMAEACEGAKIDPPATFYTLRHTYASHLVQQETPLLFVASALGHRDTRMVAKHYGHLAPSHVADMIRTKLPNFGLEFDQKVRDIRSK
jgi:integrase